MVIIVPFSQSEMSQQVHELMPVEVIHGPQRTNPSDCGDSLFLHQLPPAGSRQHASKANSQPQL